MKKLLLSLVVLASCGLLAPRAPAASLTLTTTNVMVLPPIVLDQNLVYAERTTSQVVSAGQLVKSGPRLLVAAHSGIVTNGTYTNTVVGTNSFMQCVTNIDVKILPIAVPDSGLSDYDGTVRWYRAPRQRSRVRLAVSIGSNTDYTASTVILSSASGDSWTYSASTIDDGLVGFPDALYARKTSSNDCSIVAWPW